MKIEYRRLTENELNVFISMRIKQLREEGATEEIDLTSSLLQYYTRHMADGTFVSWLAFDGDKIIGTSGMSFVEKPPYFGCPSGKIGLLSSMFTAPSYRRKGIARELLSRVINDAKEYGCGVIQITASDMGVKLYSNFGFVHNDNFINGSCHWDTELLQYIFGLLLDDRVDSKVERHRFFHGYHLDFIVTHFALFCNNVH